MTWIDLVLAIFSLGFKIWDQINEDKAAAKKLGIDFHLDQDKFLDYAQKAINRWRKETAEDNTGIGNAEDSVDREINSSPKKPTK